MADGQYTACRKTLAETVILPNEGARYGRVTYRQACLMEGIDHFKKGKYNSALKSIDNARLWPENLGVGKPYKVDERIENYFEAVCQEKKGKNSQADQLYKKVVDFTSVSNPRYSSVDFMYIMSLKSLDKDELANQFLDTWEKADPENVVQKWCRAKKNGNIDLARNVAQQINTETGGTPWDPKYADTEFEIIKALSNAVSAN
jgi:hypothetical protein